MQIPFTPDQEQLISTKLKSGKYQTAHEVVAEALRLLEERDTHNEHGNKISQDSETKIQKTWNRWFAEIDQLEPEAPPLPPDEYGQSLISKYKRQGLNL